MYFVSSTCCLCLCADKTLKNVFINDEEQVSTQKIIANVIPELAILEPEHHVYICSACYNTIHSFYTFKKKCLENNDCLKKYTSQLQRTSNNRIHEFRQLKIKLYNIQITRKEDEITTIRNEVIAKDQENSLSAAQRKSQEEETCVKEESRVFETDADLEFYKSIIKEELLKNSENSIQGFVENNSQSQSSDVILVNSGTNENTINAKTCETNKHNQVYCKNALESDISPAQKEPQNPSSEESICVKEESNGFENNADLEFYNNIIKEELVINSENLVENNSQAQNADVLSEKSGTNENRINAKTRESSKHNLVNKNGHELDVKIKYQCFICGKRFKRKSFFIKHDKHHLKVKDFKCFICGKKMARKSNLKDHLKVHSGVKEYKCKICGKEFVYKSNLNGHLKCHNGVKEFKCFTCGKEFTHRSYLSQHTKFHASVKDFKCFTCGKGFKIKSHLKRHVQTHNNVKEYRCSTCEKVFMLKSQLRLHVKCHTNRKKSTLRPNLTRHGAKLRSNVQNSNSELNSN